MSACVETMFYVREKPWHGLGVQVMDAPTSYDALILAGLDWQVEQYSVYTSAGDRIPGYKVNTRSTDHAPLGIVTDRSGGAEQRRLQIYRRSSGRRRHL